MEQLTHTLENNNFKQGEIKNESSNRLFGE
jgi:hypothetical protein